MQKFFSTSYQKLNQEQQKAVDTIEGPVMVLAGPGTGKTQILAMRIANILLKTDINPSSILALTFTESGASAMRKRLISLIGETAYQVHIQTFHSFCNDVIQSNSEFFPELSHGDALADLDRFELFRQIIQSEPLSLLRPINAPLHYVKAAMGAIQNLKREGLMPDEFEKLISEQQAIFEQEKDEMKKTERAKKEKSLSKNSELLLIYKSYQQKLKESHKFDFEDMITLTLKAFRQDELLLAEYQERLQYFLVDEYQDTNSAQNQILSLLSSFWQEKANVFVVGDPNQSIFRFQGASLENTYSFLDKFPKATIISLIENYRSTQTILDASTSIIKKSHLIPSIQQISQLDQPLHSQKNAGDLVELIEADTSALEQLWIAEKISQLLKSGTPASEIAIIVKENKELQFYAEALYNWSIPTEIEGGADILIDSLITQLISLFRLIAHIRHGTQEVNVFTVMNYSWLSLPKLVILKLSRFAGSKRLDQFSILLSQQLKEEFVSTLDESEKDDFTKIETFLTKLHNWQQQDANKTFPQLFEIVLSESGFLNHVLSRVDRISQLNKLNSLFAEIKRLAQQDHQFCLTRFIEVVDIMLEHNISLRELDLEKNSDAVRLITAHKSKGLEWQFVFLTAVIDGKWGNKKNKELLPLPDGILQHTKVDKIEKNEDERRLFYVGLTRAKKQVFITIPKNSSNGLSVKETIPSLFVEELDKKLIIKKNVSDEIKNISQLLPKLLTSENAQSTIAEDEQAYIDTILDRFKLSPTALNTYLECPYKFKLNNLYKIPRAKQPFLSFGTAIHAALEYHFSSWKKSDSPPSIDQTIHEFTISLQRELLTPDEFLIRQEAGVKLLTDYFAYYQTELRKPLYTEKPFGFGFSKTILGDIPLSGKVDKIEWVNPEQKMVKVIDYKTGNPKSRNDIEGKTKNSNGNYKRQLVFYKLLTELDRTFKLKVAEAEFDFVQPMKSGKLKKESFQIVDEELDELKQIIRDAMTKIRDYQFPKTKDFLICEKCEFKKHCWGE